MVVALLALGAADTACNTNEDCGSCEFCHTGPPSEFDTAVCVLCYYHWDCDDIPWDDDCDAFHKMTCAAHADQPEEREARANCQAVCEDDEAAQTCVIDECGARWDGYVLAPSGSRDCGACGASIESYEECQKAAAGGAAALGIGGLAERENWSGPPGCHVQDRFQWNDNRAGGSHEGHAPVCYDGVAPPPVAEPFAFEQSCAAEHEGVCERRTIPRRG